MKEYDMLKQFCVYCCLAFVVGIMPRAGAVSFSSEASTVIGALDDAYSEFTLEVGIGVVDPNYDSGDPQAPNLRSLTLATSGVIPVSDSIDVLLSLNRDAIDLIDALGVDSIATDYPAFIARSSTEDGTRVSGFVLSDGANASALVGTAATHLRLQLESFSFTEPMLIEGLESSGPKVQQVFGSTTATLVPEPGTAAAALACVVLILRLRGSIA